jgi:hypothetical protein
MQVTKYYTLVVLALLAAHHIFHISRIKVNRCIQQHQEQRISRQNYKDNERRGHAAASAQTVENAGTLCALETMREPTSDGRRREERTFVKERKLYQRKLVHRLLVYQRTTVSVYIETE